MENENNLLLILKLNFIRSGAKSEAFNFKIKIKIDEIGLSNRYISRYSLIFLKSKPFKAGKKAPLTQLTYSINFNFNTKSLFRILNQKICQSSLIELKISTFTLSSVGFILLMLSCQKRQMSLRELFFNSRKDFSFMK